MNILDSINKFFHRKKIKIKMIYRIVFLEIGLSNIIKKIISSE